ncbi:hypothetical protein PR048_013722 [Dryococelus australis]|uniref:DUF4371 domain-containing protein n=1 Tax=Dryococelus australis TaxID=614101 RepID=A0ABQ9HSY2_9NEOP|nr:hypothetical protein PR048_013722 [Dryococelus australis]
MEAHAHYLSWMSQNELIFLCGEKVLNAILEERQDAIYYGLIVDATLERFVEFLVFNAKTGKDITIEVLSVLEINQIPLEDCRAQGYDNGSNMCGKVKGVKRRILEKNNQALFSPCGAHSLNRISVNTAKIFPEVVIFFCNVESMYVFSRIVLQDAVLPIAKHYPRILKALDYILQEMSTTLQPKIYSTVVGLKKYFSSFQGLVMAVFWHKLLSCIDELNIIIQAKGISLEAEANLIKNLQQEIQNLRDSWADILQESRLVAQEMKLLPVLPEKSTRLHSIATPDASEQSTAEDKFETCVVYRVLDFFLQDLED